MKKIFLTLVLIVILISSCSKGGSTPGGGGGNGGGNGGGGNNSAITVTSVTPTNPYPDDPITIIGTGFDPDPTKDTVEFGRLQNGAFGAWHEGPATEWPSLATVTSATATQLVVKSGVPFALDYYSFPTGSSNSIAVMQIKTGGKKVVTPLIPFKRLLVLGFIKNPDQFNAQLGRPNDSLIIGGKGFPANGMSISIDGTLLTKFTVQTDANTSQATLRLPKLLFGENNDDTLVQDKIVKITNPDGKSVQKELHFYQSPRMDIFNMHAENVTYSKSGLAGSGGIIKIIMSGRCFKSDAVFKVGAIGYQAQGSLGVAGFPDSKIIELNPSSMPLGNFAVTIWRGNTLYGSCSFNLTN